MLAYRPPASGGLGHANGQGIVNSTPALSDPEQNPMMREPRRQRLVPDFLRRDPAGCHSGVNSGTPSINRADQLSP